MKLVVIMESVFGNTRDIAEAIAAGARDAGAVVDVVEAGAVLDEFNAGAFVEVDADAIVVGGPTHAWSMSRASTRNDALRQAAAHGVTPVSTRAGIREWIAAVAPRLRTRHAATFDTAGVARMPVGSAARRAAAALKKIGYALVVPPEQFRVLGVAGPLVEGEAARARRWGRALAERCAEQSAAAVDGRGQGAG